MTNVRHHLLNAWSIYPAMLLFGIGLVICAGFMPPHQPSASAAEIAAIYRSHSNMIQVGMILLLTGGVLFVPFFAAIGWQMVRIEGSRPILASTQMMIGVITAVLIILPNMAFTIAAFRPERDPELIRRSSCGSYAWPGFFPRQSSGLIRSVDSSKSTEERAMLSTQARLGAA